VTTPVDSRISLGKVFARYALAVMLVSASLLLRFALIRYFGDQLPPFITLFPAVMIAALLCGLGPGLLATALSAFATDFFVLQPTGSFVIVDPSQALGLALFVAESSFISLIAARYRSNQRLVATHKEDEILRRSEEELRKASEYRQLAFDAGGMGTWEMRRDSREFSTDDAFRNLYRVHPEGSLSYDTFRKSIHPEDRAKVDGVFELALTGAEGVLWGPEYRVVWPDGSIHWIATYGQAFTGGKPEIDKLVGVSMDITERKQAEETLRRSEQDLRLLFEQTPDGVFISDAQGRFLDVNSAGVELMGYAPDELRGLTIPDVLPAEEAERLPYELGRLAGGSVAHSEWRYKRKDGSIFHGSNEARRLSDGRYLAMVRDVTKAKRAEEELRERERQFQTLANSIPQLCWTANPNGEIFWYNQRWYDYTGTTPEQMESGGWQSVMSPEALPAVMAQIKSSIDSKSECELTYPLKGADGVFRSFLTRVVPIFNADGEVLRWIGTNTDITDQMRAEERIRQLNRVYSVLSDINETIVRENNSQAMLEIACRIAVEKGQFRMAWIGMIDVARQQLIRAASSGFVDGYLDRVKIDLHDPNRTGGPVAYCIRSGKHAICNDIENELMRPWKNDALQNGYRSVAAFPLRCEGKIAGVFCLYASEIAFFDEAETRLLDELAADISFAMDVNRNEEDRKEKEEELQRLNRVYSILSNVNRTIIHEKNPAVILQSACQIVVELGRFQMAWVGMIDEERREVKPVASFGNVDGYLNQIKIELHDESGAEGPVLRCVRSGEHAVCNDIEHETAYLPWRDEALRRDYRSSAALPLSVGGQVIGVLNLYASQIGFFKEDEVLLLGKVASDISFALEVNRHEADRKKAEENLKWQTAFFKAQVDSAFDGVLVVDPAGKKILQNQRLNELFKIPPSISGDSNDAPQVEFVTQLMKDPQQFAEKVSYLASHPDEVSRDQIELLDGSIFERYSYPVRDKALNHYGRIWTFRDITERRQLEEQFRQSQKMEAIGQLTGGIAHDFNNLLAVIIGNLDLLERQIKDNDAAVKRVNTARNASLRGAELTRRLLAFARQQDLRPAALDLNAIIQTVLALAAPALGPSIQVVTRLAPSIPNVFADASGLESALLNLVVNARDAMPKGGKLTVTSEQRTMEAGQFLGKANELTPGDYGFVTVSDTGHGMSKDIAQKVFEPFFTTKVRGTGLGLAMVYGFFKQSGGTVRIYSEPGSGTSFSLFLPIVEDAAKVAFAPVLETQICNITTGTILIVDDEPDLLEVASTCLIDLGYTVLTVADGFTAIEVLKERADIGLLLTDILMPGGMNGVELAQRAIEIRSNIRVIYCSGFPADALAERNLSLVEGPLLRKPYQRSELIAIVREVLASPLAE
jgi:PAS domain S-box-containing protein